MKAQETTFELDHFFVAVSGPEAGASALEESGFMAGPSNTHPGQGTASRGILFENAYLEMIWLTSPTEAGSPAIRRTRLRERTDPGSQACPFGIGLRGKGDGETRLPFGTWDYRPPYLPEGLSFLMGENSVELGEPLVFFLPWLSAPGWPPSEHPNGARRITGMEIVLGVRALASETVSALSDAGVVSVRPGQEYLMEVELDDGRSGETLDLRPEIPLVIRW